GYVKHPNGMVVEFPLLGRAPAGGFDYSGPVTFDLQPGDVYGFHMTGANADSAGRLTGTLSLTPPLTVARPAARTTTIDTAASVKLSARGGVGPYVWSSSGLPAGLALDPATAVSSGTPVTAGTSTVTVTAADAETVKRATATQTFTWTVTPPAAPCQPGQLLPDPGFEHSYKGGWDDTGAGPIFPLSGQAVGQPHSGRGFVLL